MSTPRPYKFCDLHMKPDYGPNRCHECFGVNTAPQEPQSAPTPKKEQPGEEGPPLLVPSSPASIPPAVTDPEALKIIDAAQKYADSIQAIAIISNQLKEARELVSALEKKLSDSKKIAQEAMKITQEAAK